jgi:sphingomyelin phosphodiesterase 2
MQIMFKHANLIDSWAETHGPPPSTPIGPNTPTNAAAAMETFGLTVDTPLNTWSHGKPLDGFARRWLGKRLDYILFRSPFPNSEPSLKIQETKIVMTEKVPGYNFSLSDHFGLEATFTIQSQPTTRDIRASAEDSGHGAHEQVRGRVKLGRLPEDGLMAAISALSFEYREAQGRAHRHLAYFGGCVGLLLFVLIGSAWVGHRAGWVAPVATLLGGLATWWGTTSLYVGFVYGRWERGILDNLIEEIEAVRYAGLRDIESSSHVMRGY